MLLAAHWARAGQPRQPGQPHSDLATAAAGKAAELAADVRTLLDFWESRTGLLLSKASDEDDGPNKYELQGRGWELRSVCDALAHLGLPLASSPAVQQAVDDAVAGQAAKVATCVVDLIDAWTERARAADAEASRYAAAMADRETTSETYRGLQWRKAESEGEANAIRRCIAELRQGNVVPA
jgi:hypothetical protein